MLAGFYCPDGEKITIEDCFKECRLGERCLTLPTLTLIAEEREWKGLASTTQLINGTMMEFLELTNPYYIDPDSRAFSVQGTKHHLVLEEMARKLGLPAEIALSGDRDIVDFIEIEDGGLNLTDYKLWGSFKVAKALGIVESGIEPDPSGALYKRAGKYGKAGDPKMIPVFSKDPDKADNLDAELQLNRYRTKLEDYGLLIDRMQLQITVRDGGLYVAKNRGVFKNFYKVPVKRLEDDYIESYFALKDSCLHQALDEGRWTTPCTPHESWEGLRCDRYCDVKELCPKGKLIQEIGEEAYY